MQLHSRLTAIGAILFAILSVLTALPDTARALPMGDQQIRADIIPDRLLVQRNWTCGRGYDWIPELGRCMPDSYRRRRGGGGAWTCGPGYDWIPELGRCMPDSYRRRRGGGSGWTCGPGFDWIPELGRCMPDSYRRRGR